MLAAMNATNATNHAFLWMKADQLTFRRTRIRIPITVSVTKNHRSITLPSVGSLFPPGKGTPQRASHIPKGRDATTKYQRTGQNRSLEARHPRFRSERKAKKMKTALMKSASLGGISAGGPVDHLHPATARGDWQSGLWKLSLLAGRTVRVSRQAQPVRSVPRRLCAQPSPL